MSLNLAHFLEMSAESLADKTAVMLDEHRLSYAELNAFAKRVANVLKDRGVEKGDKVAMMIPNSPFFPIIYYGILNAGATVVPVNVLFKSHEIQYCLEDSDAKVFLVWRLFYDEAMHAFEETDTCHHLIVASMPDDIEEPPEGDLLVPLVMGASAEADHVETMPDDTAVILYTSGTTGHPKGAELTHFNMFFNAYYTQQSITEISSDDVVLGVLPLFHSFGQTCIMNAALMAGCTITLVPSFHTEKVMEVIERDRVTVVAMVPTMYFFLLNVDGPERFDLSTVRMAVSGGSALPVEVFRAFQERYGVEILEGYGLSETSPVASFNTTSRACRPGSIGQPIWGCEMRIMREDGTFAAPGEVGEIVIRGHNVMKGYYKKPAATEEAIVDGWLHTGDLAQVDEDGYFFIVDRKKDVIIRGGMNVYPREIEEVLYGHPAILEASVIGVPDAARGEEVKAYVALRPGEEADEEELRAYCKSRLARFKCPSEFEVVAELPKGPTGKILKRVLRETVRKEGR
ncbi:MAG: long-chain fatty acid--CoA ligase [Candidatus Hydrogenedentes bacterium]|nr:long-chain fatty acid--CoA ligase [Candidatus Hydrogenedentota bacterium]